MSGTCKDWKDNLNRTGFMALFSAPSPASLFALIVLIPGPLVLLVSHTPLFLLPRSPSLFSFPRSLDLIAKNPLEFKVWTEGLRYLIRKARTEPQELPKLKGAYPSFSFSHSHFLCFCVTLHPRVAVS